MPFAEEDIINKLRKVANIKSVTDLLKDLKTPEKLLEYILGDLDLNILETIPTRFYCNCSKKEKKAIISIGKK